MAQYIKINYNSKWTGYKNYGDIANQSITDLCAGSQNVFVVDGKKLEVRAGMEYLGPAGTDATNTDPYWTLAHRIHSSDDSFVNNQGITIPIRVFYSGNTDQGDVMEAWLPVNGDITSDIKDWIQITPNTPSTPLISTHQYYFTSGWYDPQHLQNQLVFTYGAKGSGSNYVVAWSGGFAPITAITGTTITTNTTWQEKGFIDPPEGPALVVVNDVEYNITSGDFSTDTITVSSTAGISVGDLAFQGMQFDTLPGTFTGDVCSLINNQVYYIDWNNRSVLVSWNRNRDGFLSDTVYQGTSGLNDAIFSGTYTGSTTDTFEVTIDSVNPATETQSFYGSGLNDGTWDTSGYTGTSNNTYRIIIVADFSFTFSGTPTPIPTPGETLTGNTSGAQGVVVTLDSGGQDPVLQLLPGSPAFQAGETVTGTISGLIPQTIFSAGYGDWFRVYKNGTPIQAGAPYSTPPGFFYFPIFTAPTTFIVADGITFVFTTYIGHTIGDYWQLTADAGSPDTFTWSLNGVSKGSNIDVSTSNISLAEGVRVKFTSLTGHDVGDKWTMVAYPKIIRGWREFYFTTPVRLAGEGYKILLDSNGWTMTPQENTMYINALAGHFYTAKSQLSADLTSETITVQRLKSEAQNKVLFPYLISYIKNQLATISQDKTYDILGRQKFLELPQTKSISDWVRVDFETADWEDGCILYYKRKIYFSVPRTGYIFVWDDFMKYWHPPLKFAKGIGNLAIIDNKLCGHSYERNETYQLLVGTNDLSDFPIQTKMVFAYDGNGARLAEKSVSAIGFEGYVTANPQIMWQINCGVGGCDGTPNGVIRPVLCKPKDTASLGKSTLGFHGEGNSPVTPATYFNYIKPFGNTSYYLRNMELTCSSPDQRWSIVSIGTDMSKDNINNASIVDVSLN